MWLYITYFQKKQGEGIPILPKKGVGIPLDRFTHLGTKEKGRDITLPATAKIVGI